jgi:hypothetical protein
MPRGCDISPVVLDALGCCSLRVLTECGNERAQSEASAFFFFPSNYLWINSLNLGFLLSEIFLSKSGIRDWRNERSASSFSLRSAADFRKPVVGPAALPAVEFYFSTVAVFWYRHECDWDFLCFLTHFFFSSFSRAISSADSINWY